MPNPSYAYFDGIEGSCEQKGREGAVTILDMDHAVEIPVDVKDATATGTRRHGSMKLVANIDKATPLLFERVCKSDEIKKLKIEFWRTDATGKEVNYFNINMEKVRVVKAQLWFPNVDAKETANYKHMMSYSIRYDKIEWVYTDGNLAFADQWKAPNV